MPTTLVFILLALMSLRRSIPEWQSDVDKWIEKDKESFLKFKETVFKTMENCKHSLGNDGYEKL